MKKWSYFFLSTLMLGMALGFAGCKKSAEESAADDKVIKVGEFASLTGKEATFGISSHEGTQLAVEDINAKGGLLK